MVVAAVDCDLAGARVVARLQHNFAAGPVALSVVLGNKIFLLLFFSGRCGSYRPLLL